MAPSAVPPEEVLAPPSRDEAYLAFRAATDLRSPYRVAPEFLAGTQRHADFDALESPLIVFINARSGGRTGPELADVLCRALGRSQVFDLAHHRPDQVLARIWANLEEQQAAGNPRAALVRSRLRILAAGGDGTVAWILKCIAQLRLQPAPAVAIMPLGTGNDLSRSFRWGPVFEAAWVRGHASVYSTLKRVADARAVELDRWRLRLLLPDASYRPASTYAVAEVPLPPAAAAAAAAHSVQQPPDAQLVLGAAGLGQGLGGGLVEATAAAPGCAGEGGAPVLLEGTCFNYISIGADAQAAYAFHHLRDTHPALAGNPTANKFWYSTLSCTSGWFCGGVPSVARFGSVQVLQPGACEWSELAVPASVKALVLCNLQSYGGGRNIWGEGESRRKAWRTPSVADGLLEVVGFTHGWQAMSVMASNAKLAHGKRLAQVAGIRVRLRQAPRAAPAADAPTGERAGVFMQLDGEPWLQQVPAGGRGGDSSVLLEVVHAGAAKVLVNSSEPAGHPVSKMTHMLTQQQQGAMLSAVAQPSAAQLPAGAELAAAALQEQQEQQPGEPSGQARVLAMLGPSGERLCRTDGGADSSEDAATPLARRSLPDVAPGSSGAAAAAGPAPGTAGSSPRSSLLESPVAVAVIAAAPAAAPGSLGVAAAGKALAKAPGASSAAGVRVAGLTAFLRLGDTRSASPPPPAQARVS